jgi:hypothetical protein
MDVLDAADSPSSLKVVRKQEINGRHVCTLHMEFTVSLRPPPDTQAGASLQVNAVTIVPF